MKKQMIFMMAGSLLALASCNNGGTTAPSDAMIDSLVNAKLQVKEMQLVAKNDSIINAMATMKADSIMMAMKGAPATARTATHTTTKVTTPPSAPTPSNPKDAKFQQMAGQQQGQQNQITPEQKKAKDDKFSKMQGK